MNYHNLKKINLFLLLTFLTTSHKNYSYTLFADGSITLGTAAGTNAYTLHGTLSCNTAATDTGALSFGNTTAGGNVTIGSKPAGIITISGPTLAGGGAIVITGPVNMNLTGTEISNIGNVTFTNPTWINPTLNTSLSSTQITIGNPATSPGKTVINTASPLTNLLSATITGRCSIGSSVAAPLVMDLSNAYVSADLPDAGSAYYIQYNTANGRLVRSPSSKKYKENIQLIDKKMAEAFDRLAPSSFNFKNSPTYLSYGLIAEDVDLIPEFKGLVYRKNEEIDGVDYHALFIIHMKKTLELNSKIKDLENKLQAVLDFLTSQGFNY